MEAWVAEDRVRLARSQAARRRLTARGSEEISRNFNRNGTTTTTKNTTNFKETNILGHHEIVSINEIYHLKNLNDLIMTRRMTLCLDEKPFPRAFEA